MVKRRSKAIIPYRGFFCPPNPCGGGSPVDSILAEVGNTLVSHGLQKLSQSLADRLGLVNPEAEIRLNRSMLSLKKPPVPGITAGG